MRRRTRTGNRIKISNTLRISLILLSIIIMAIGSGNLIKSFNTKDKSITENTILYKYDNKFSSDAKINLKENSYINDDEILDGQTYLSDLISDINMDIKYKYTATDSSKIEYTYKVEAVMKATYTDSKNSYDVLNKIDKIKEESSVTDVANELSIADKVTVDYSKYHHIMKEFKQTMGISTDSQLYIRYTIDTKTNIASKDITNQYIANYKISIGDKVAIIEPIENDQTSKTIKDDDQQIRRISINYKTAIINLIVIFVGISICMAIINKTEELKSIKNEFKLELNRILKSYEDKIVEIQDLKNFNIKKATKVKDIIQLRKLAEEAFVPIYCYINEDEAYFIVSKYENRYVFILR